MYTFCSVSPQRAEWNGHVVSDEKSSSDARRIQTCSSPDGSRLQVEQILNINLCA